MTVYLDQSLSNNAAFKMFPLNISCGIFSHTNKCSSLFFLSTHFWQNLQQLPFLLILFSLFGIYVWKCRVSKRDFCFESCQGTGFAFRHLGVAVCTLFFEISCLLVCIVSVMSMCMCVNTILEDNPLIIIG